MPRQDTYHPRVSTNLSSSDPLASEIPPCPDGYRTPDDTASTNRMPSVRLDMLCSECGTRALIPAESFDGSCPRCGRIYYVLTCTRCGNTWRRRDPSIPKVSPKCKNPYWCRERTRSRARGSRRS